MKTALSRRSRPAAPAASRRPVDEPLSRERIVAAALQEIEASSLAGFSTRKLGERLGVQAMSIYHHFPSKQHLLDALVDQAIAAVEVPQPTGEPAEDEKRLRRCMHSYRTMAHRMPALFPLVAVHRLNTPTGVRFIESVLRLIRSMIDDDELAARHFRVMGYFLAGAELDETSGYARGPSAAEPVGNEFIARECPNLIAAAPFFDQRHWDATFELGLDAIFDKLRSDIAALKKARRRGR